MQLQRIFGRINGLDVARQYGGFSGCHQRRFICVHRECRLQNVVEPYPHKCLQIQELRGSLWFPRDGRGRLLWPHGNRSLHAYLLQNGAMSAADAKYVFKQLVNVVVACHKKGIIHCDIKPENIAIDTDLKVFR